MNSTSVSALAWSELPYKSAHTYTLNVIIPLLPAVILFGLVSNSTNVIVFLKAGLGDSVTILLFYLSVSDVIFLSLITPTVATIIIFYFVPDWDWTVDHTITYTLLYWPALTFYDYSAYISVFLGVTRCACVAMPLHFKSVFTKKRTVFAVFALFCLSVIFHLPVLTIFRIGWKFNPQKNTTYLVIVDSGRQTMVKINDILNRISMPWISFTTMIGCVALLSFKLFEASKIRSFPSGAEKSRETSDLKQTQSQKLSPKEVHVVQSVVLVCTIFILAQLPSLLNSTIRVINPEFDHGGRLVMLFGIAFYISLTCSFLNASLNIFVYFNYNSKYRAVLKSLLRLQSDSFLKQ